MEVLHIFRSVSKFYSGYSSHFYGNKFERIRINNIVYNFDTIFIHLFYKEVYEYIKDKELLEFLQDNMEKQKILIARNFEKINISDEEVNPLIVKYK